MKKILALTLILVMALSTVSVMASDFEFANIVPSPIANFDFDENAPTGFVEETEDVKFTDANKLRVVTDAEGNKYGYIHTISTDTGTKNLGIVDNYTAHDRVTIEMDFAVNKLTGDADTAWNIWAVSADDPAAATYAEIQVIALALYRDTTNNLYKLRVADGGYPGYDAATVKNPNTYLSVTMEYEKWYHIKMEMNFNTNNHDVYLYDIDGKLINSTRYARKIGTPSYMRSYNTLVTTNNVGDWVKWQGKSAFNRMQFGAKKGSILCFDNIKVTKEKFTTPAAPVITDDIADGTGKIKATAKVGNEVASEQTSPVLVLAAYDKTTKQLIDVAVDFKTIPAKSQKSKPQEVTLTSEMLRPAVDYELKAFLWTGFENLKPYFYPVESPVVAAE